MRALRAGLVGLAIVLATAILPAAPGAAPADSLPDTTGIYTGWRIEPANPCVDDSVFMIVRGFVATPCDSFIGAEALTPLFVRIRQQIRPDRACFTGPTIFYPVPLALGRFAAGTHLGIVEVETTLLRADGTSTLERQQFQFGVVVAPECSIPPPPTPAPLPYVHTIRTEPPRPCAWQPTSLVLEGAFPSGCGQVVDTYVQDPHNVHLTLRPFALPDTVCPAVLKPWRADFPLGPLPSGPHRTNITMVVYQPDSLGGGIIPTFHYGSHEFFVFGDCDTIPSPIPGLPPYVEQVVVGPGGPCLPPVCPGDSIRVRASGVFPNDCYSLRGVQVIPSPAMIVPPQPPIVRFIVDDGACVRRVCGPGQPWSASVALPPMPAGTYQLPVEVAQVTCSSTYPPGQLYRSSAYFRVGEDCRDSIPCLEVAFDHGTAECHATVGIGRPAELTFRAGSAVALAGLQGEFRLDLADLTITGIEAIGPAQGMLLDWQATAGGARFVLFAGSGAPIPPNPPVDMRDITQPGWPVLKVTLEYLQRGGVPPARTVLTTHDLLASDAQGNGVLPCPPPPCVGLDLRAPMGWAVICGETPCDVNADASQDVRDLVLMVRCMNGEGACPPEPDTRLDCNGDGTFALADVLCCARRTLQQAPCPDCPPDTGQVRPAPGVAVSIGSPVTAGDGIELPFEVSGLESLGAAMLTLEAPLDRYEVVGFDVSPAGGWMALHEVRDGRIVLGLVAVGSRSSLEVGVSPRFTLALALRAGQPAGGRVTVVAGEFSGPDGVTLGVELGRPTQALPGGARIALGPNRPNPFSNETVFALDLTGPADVVVGIYDLRGRAVANLHRGPLPAGPHTFRWDGRAGDGTTAPDGVYFYKASMGGTSFARKLILMKASTREVRHQ